MNTPLPATVHATYDNASEPNETGAGAAPHRINWAAPDLVYTSWRWPAQVLILVLLIGLSLLDAYLMTGPLASVLRESPTATTNIAFGVALASALIAAWTGWTLRGARGNHPDSRSHLVLPAVSGVAWLTIGLGIAAVRVTASTTRTQFTYDAPAATGGASAAAWWGAVLFLAVYFGVGALAFGDLYHLRQDAAAALRRAVKKRERLVRELEQAQALEKRVIEIMAIRAYETSLLPGRAEQAKAINAAHALALKQLSRHEQAVRLGDPSGTGITSPRHPVNPASSPVLPPSLAAGVADHEQHDA